MGGSLTFQVLFGWASSPPLFPQWCLWLAVSPTYSCRGRQFERSSEIDGRCARTVRYFHVRLRNNCRVLYGLEVWDDFEYTLFVCSNSDEDGQALVRALRRTPGPKIVSVLRCGDNRVLRCRSGCPWALRRGAGKSSRLRLSLYWKRTKRKKD